MSSLALLGFKVVATAALTWLGYKGMEQVYKKGKSKYLKYKEKRQALPKLATGKIEKSYKGIPKQQKVSQNKAKLLKEQIKTIGKESQITFVSSVSNRKNVGKTDVQEQVHIEEAVEEEEIKSMVKHNFNGCNDNCNCCHAIQHTTEKVQNEAVEEEEIKSMVKRNFNGCNENCNSCDAIQHTTEKVQNEETMDLEEEHTTDFDYGIPFSDDLPKNTKLPQTLWEENEDGDDEALDTTPQFTSIKSKDSSDSSIASESTLEEPITGIKNAAPDFEIFQNSTPIAFPSKKCEFDLSFKIPKLKLPTGKKRKFAGAVEGHTELPNPSSATNSGGEHEDSQISKKLQDDHLTTELNKKIQTGSNTFSDDAATKETFHVPDYPHGAWIPSDGSSHPPWNKALFPPEPVSPSPHHDEAPRSGVSLLAYLDKFDEEEAKPAAISRVIDEKDKLNIVEKLLLADKEEVVVSYDNFDVMRTTGAAIREASRDKDLEESMDKGLGSDIANDESDVETENGDLDVSMEYIPTFIEDVFDANSFSEKNRSSPKCKLDDNTKSLPVYYEDSLKIEIEELFQTDLDSGASVEASPLESSQDIETGDIDAPKENETETKTDEDDVAIKDGTDTSTISGAYRINVKDCGSQVVLENDSNDQLIDQDGNHASHVNVSLVVNHEQTLNDLIDFEDDDVRMVTIKGDSKFINQTLPLIVEKSKQNCEEASTSGGSNGNEQNFIKEEQKMNPMPVKKEQKMNPMPVKKEQKMNPMPVKKEQKMNPMPVKEDQMTNPMPAKKEHNISHEVITISSDEDGDSSSSSGSPSLVYSTLPWNTSTQNLQNAG